MLALIFLIIFPFALYKAMQNVKTAKASTNWPTTPGTVRASDIKKVMFRRQPQIAYSYSVNGAPFTSQRISFASGYKSNEVDQILARYPVGASRHGRARSAESGRSDAGDGFEQTGHRAGPHPLDLFHPDRGREPP